ncbi:PQQ-binding-like beta-propeller repeat protein [Planctomycetaceae bacterium SH139]
MAVPETWSRSNNLKWAVELPGRGVSSPIVVGDDVFVTAFKGEGINALPSGEASQLVRSLVCVDRTSGEIKWQRSLKSNVAEDSYEGFLTDHGYASSTPVSMGSESSCSLARAASTRLI